ncbi:hypothetical protein V2J09_004908 [Rumex salicifolius]
MGGPWTIFGQCLMVHNWSADFNPSRDTIKTVCAWVRFTNLPVILYDERVLHHIATSLGRPLRVDRNTSQATRGKFARINLSKSLKGAILINGELVLVEYEGLGDIGLMCGRQGHLAHLCPSSPCPLVARSDAQGEGGGGQLWRCPRLRGWPEKEMVSLHNNRRRPLTVIRS